MIRRTPPELVGAVVRDNGAATGAVANNRPETFHTVAVVERSALGPVEHSVAASSTSCGLLPLTANGTSVST